MEDKEVPEFPALNIFKEKSNISIVEIIDDSFFSSCKKYDLRYAYRKLYSFVNPHATSFRNFYHVIFHEDFTSGPIDLDTIYVAYENLDSVILPEQLENEIDRIGVNVSFKFVDSDAYFLKFNTKDDYVMFKLGSKIKPSKEYVKGSSEYFRKLNMLLWDVEEPN